MSTKFWLRDASIDELLLLLLLLQLLLLLLLLHCMHQQHRRPSVCCCPDKLAAVSAAETLYLISHFVSCWFQVQLQLRQQQQQQQQRELLQVQTAPAQLSALVRRFRCTYTETIFHRQLGRNTICAPSYQNAAAAAATAADARGLLPLQQQQ